MSSALISVAAVTISLAVAQSQIPDQEVRTGSRIPVKVDKREHELMQVRRVQDKFAKCVVAKKRGHVLEYLQHYPAVNGDDRSSRRLVRSLADGNCLVGSATGDFDMVQMNLPGDTMRYILADAIIRDEGNSASHTELGLAAALQHPQFDEAEFQAEPGKKQSAKELEELADDRRKEIGRIFLSHYGECVVRANPGLAHALLLTDPTSDAESAAFQRLVPFLGQCLDAGQSLSFNKIVVRGTIAHNFFRLSRAPRQPGNLPAQGREQ